MIEVRCFGSLEEAAFLRDEVNALNRAGARPDPFSEEEFRRRDEKVYDLRVSTLGPELAAQRSPDDGKRSPVEIY